MSALKDFLQLEEREEKINTFISYIVKNYNKEEVASKIEKKAVDEYVPADWEEKASDQIEWYEKYGEGQAEEDVIREIYQEVSSKKNVRLNSSEYADLQNWFYNAYNL